MRKQLLIGGLAGAAALVPFTATAASPGYTYVDLAYVSADIDDGPTLDGWGLDGSFRISNELHIVGSYTEVTKGRFEVDLSRLGLGYNQSLTGNTDFVARAGWARADVEVRPFGSDSDNGWFAEVGVRSMVTEALELNGFLTHTDAGGSDTAASIGGVYSLTPMIGVTLDASFSDDAKIYQGGIRFAF
ncbi:MAG: hypothetical protein KF911_03160 [Pseudomonadales bacterium]|nr:hypothetical protein [Pseudomonadales bacterium]